MTWWIIKALFGWKNIITYHPKTHFLSLKNLRISPKPGLAPKPSYVFKSKISKMWDPRSNPMMWLCRWVVVVEANAH